MKIEEILHELEERSIEHLDASSTVELDNTVIHSVYLNGGDMMLRQKYDKFTIYSKDKDFFRAIMWPTQDCSELDGQANWISLLNINTDGRFRSTGLANFDESQLGTMLSNLNKMLAHEGN